jgi:type I restriction enzyme S subunit
VGRIQVSLPTIDEQRRIANFLDREMEMSRRLLDLRRQQLVVAQDRFNAQLVTAILTASGGSNRARLKYLFDFSRNGVWGQDPVEGSNDVVCVRVADFDRFSFKAGRNASTLRAVEPMQFIQRRLHCGDVLIEKSGGGETSPVGFAVNFDGNVESVCSNFVGQLRPAKGHDARYIGLLMAALYVSGRNVPHIKQTTGIQNLDGPAYLGQEVEVPNYRAQKAIAAGLDNMLDSLGAYFAGVDRQLACMQERRQALITAAVTGQIDVTTARGADV